jgi:dienelactone hydrolase
MRLTALAVLATLTLSAQAGVDEALKRPVLVSDQTRVDTQVWLASKVPVLNNVPSSPDAWNSYAATLRQRVLDEVVYRGAAREWRQQQVKVEYVADLPGDGYIVRKLRFEAVPGLVVPALLYVPSPAPSGPTPVVLNVNGHEGTGIGNSYIQARCINLAKKGMYALNVEWIGQSQLANDGLVHYRMNQLDLVGTPGLAVFYESLRRSVDIALGLPHADATRIAVTGLSGGGWQTIMISALDTRVTLASSVAGHSSFVTRTQWPDKDLGDSEQTPSDLASVVDYVHLNALMAPRPLQLSHNAKDSCCFRADYALGPMVQQVTPVYRLLNVPDRFAYHVNHDEGHNYERDNREALYRFLHRHFFKGSPSFDPREVDVTKELRDVKLLATPLPENNADFTSLARRIAAGLPRPGTPRRERLGELVRYQRYDVRAVEAGTGDGAAYWKLHMNHWTVPAVELTPTPDAVEVVRQSGATGTTLLLADDGRASTGDAARALLDGGQRVVAVDPFYFGESSLGQRDFLFGLLVSSLGERPLGIQAGQVAASARWLARRQGGYPVRIAAHGPRTSLIALVAAALEPDAISGVRLHGGWQTLRAVFDQNISAQQMPEMFAFGLLAEFDIEQTRQLVAPRPVVFE